MNDNGGPSEADNLRYMLSLVQLRVKQLEAILDSYRDLERAGREEAFKAGYHCRWHNEQGFYRFDPAMSPGDPDGAYRAWLVDKGEKLQ